MNEWEIPINVSNGDSLHPSTYWLGVIGAILYDDLPSDFYFSLFDFRYCSGQVFSVKKDESLEGFVKLNALLSSRRESVVDELRDRLPNGSPSPESVLAALVLSIEKIISIFEHTREFEITRSLPEEERKRIAKQAESDLEKLDAFLKK